jgi:hypothetical protein
MNKVYYEADVVISIPCLKNHCLADITGGVKNVAIGVSPANIYGPSENEFTNGNFDRSIQGIDHGYLGYRAPLHNWIHDYYLCKPVDFVIMDGLNGLQNGPLAHASLNNGSETLSDDQKNMRLILASNDAIAIDAIQSLIMGVDPQLVEYLVYLHNNSAGCGDPNQIRINGNVSVSQVKKKFENGDDGANAQYTDFEPPTFLIRSFDINEKFLSLILDVDKDVEKVEFRVKGKLLDQIILGDFENISIELPEENISENDIEIIVYDRYLNESIKILQVTGIDELTSIEENIKIYPNPAYNYLVVKFKDKSTSRKGIDIFNLNGELFYHKDFRISGGPIEQYIDVSSFPIGTYVIKIKSTNEESSFKILKL